MIEDPWIILVVNRRKLGAPVYAVARGERRDGRVRRTMKVRRARGFPTERRATNAARKLLDKHQNEYLFVVVKLTEGDLPRPKPDVVYRQTEAFTE